MRQLRYIIYFIFALLFASCEVDPIDEVTGNEEEGTPVEMILRFGAQSPISTNATTRATLTHVSDESRIYNIYVFIFDSNGNKVFGRYFDNKTNLHQAVSTIMIRGVLSSLALLSITTLRYLSLPTSTHAWLISRPRSWAWCASRATL